MDSRFDLPEFKDEAAARARFEAIRWPNGPICPHCQSAKFYATKKEGRYRCAAKDCRKDFTVTTRSVMESSHIPLRTWLHAYHLLCASKKGMSSLQFARMLGCEWNTAWFLSMRIRKAMESGSLDLPMGGEGSVIEADEMYIGRQEAPTPSKNRRGAPYLKPNRPAPKRQVVSLVERGGSVRSFHVAAADKHEVSKIVRKNVDPKSRLHTDESPLYTAVGTEFAKHERVNHSRGEYARGKGADLVTTNSAEGYFGVFKRGFNGIYQHCREKHLHRYLAEFDFRYNTRAKLGFNDMDRTVEAIKGAEGKRLTYRRPDSSVL